jgi:flagellar biosynthesis regulator FlbT
MNNYNYFKKIIEISFRNLNKKIILIHLKFIKQLINQQKIFKKYNTNLIKYKKQNK